MEDTLKKLKKWMDLTEPKHGCNTKVGTKQFCIIRKVNLMTEKEPIWFTSYRKGQNQINIKILDGLKDLSTRVGSLEVKVDKIETKISEIEVKVEKIEVKVDKIETKIGEIEVKVDKIENVVKQAHPELF